MNILVIDNYDSFTYNLVTLLRDHTNGARVDVVRNDQISIEEVDQYDKILISPGPSVPDNAGISKELIKRYAPTKCILGICLGHQAIAEVFGAKIYNMSQVYHGYQGTIQFTENDLLYKNFDNEAAIGLYHSWSIDRSSIPEVLEVTAESTDGLIMGIRHREYDVKGLQFHPESILTENGAQYIKNWLLTTDASDKQINTYTTQHQE